MRGYTATANRNISSVSFVISSPFVDSKRFQTLLEEKRFVNGLVGGFKIGGLNH